MTIDPKRREPPEPGSPEDLHLDRDDSIEKHDHDAEKIEEEGEPFDGFFA